MNNELHWTQEPLFLTSKRRRLQHPISAIQIRQAVDEYVLALDDVLDIVDAPNHSIAVHDVVQAVAKQESLTTLVKYCIRKPATSVDKRINSASPAPTLPNMIVASHPASSAQGDDTATQHELPSRRTMRKPNPWARLHATQLSESLDLWYWIPLAAYIYGVAGLGLYFFVRTNPDLSVLGILSAAVGSIFPTLAVAFSLFMFTGGKIRGKWDIESRVGAAFGATVFIIAGSLSFRSGYNHINENQLGSFSVLVDECLADSIVRGNRTGAICSDGWVSSSRGAGTCSHHRGVSEWTYENRQTKSIKECRETALKILWTY